MNMYTAIVTIAASLLGSTGIATLIQFFISRYDKKSDQLSSIEGRLVEIEKRLDERELDSIRAQMLLLISDYPKNRTEIMKLAKYYFVDLNGDWYVTAIYNRWLTDNNIAKPEWFDDNK